MNRQPFQLHLSTALLLMLTTATLMWLNLAHEISPVVFPEEPDKFKGLEHVRYGWPFTARLRFQRGKDATSDLFVREDGATARYRSSSVHFASHDPALIVGLIADVIIAVTLLMFLAVSHTLWLRWWHKPVEVEPDNAAK